MRDCTLYKKKEKEKVRPFRIAFFGHRHIEEERYLEPVLENLLQRLGEQYAYIEYTVGRHGDFDRCAASAVRRVYNRIGWDRADLILVLPYMTAEFRDNEEEWLRYYGEIRVSDASSMAHPKAAIGVRNREMVDRADLVVCFVTNMKGGAYDAVSYARKIGKPVWNLADTIRNK